MTGDDETDLLVTAPFQDATPDNDSVPGGFVKEGPGTMEMTGASIFTGTTDVQAGTLEITGGGSTISSLLRVASGALIDVSENDASPFPIGAGQAVGGDGTVRGDLAMAGDIAPGASAGALTVDGSLTLEESATYTWEVADWDGGAGTGYDTLTAGDIDVQATSANPVTIVITPDELQNFSESDRTFTLASATGSVTNFSADAFDIDAAAFAGSGVWSVQLNGGDIELTYNGGTDAYTTWAEGTHALAGGDASGEADPDAGSIANVIEFVTGGDPNDPSDDLGLVPTGEVDGTDFLIVFRRSSDSAYLNPGIEYNLDLQAAWTTAEDGVDGVSITVVPDGFEAGIDRVEVRIPQALAGDGRLFARMTAEAPF